MVMDTSAWLVSGITFLLGILVKYLFNKITTPRLEIDKHIALDNNQKQFVRVRNRSRRRWLNAYDIQLFIRYYEGGKRYHTKMVEDGLLKRDSDDMYSIILKGPKGEEISFDFSNTDNRVEVVLLYRNRFGTLSHRVETLVD